MGPSCVFWPTFSDGELGARKYSAGESSVPAGELWSCGAVELCYWWIDRHLCYCPPPPPPRKLGPVRGRGWHRSYQGTAEHAPSPFFCSVLACSGAPAEQTRFVLLCHPATPRWSRRAGGTAGPRLGKEAGAAWGPPPIARASRVGGGLWGGGSSKNQRSLRQNLLCWRSEPRDLRAQCTVSAQTALTHFIVPSQAGPTDLVRA